MGKNRIASYFEIKDGITKKNRVICHFEIEEKMEGTYCDIIGISFFY